MADVIKGLAGSFGACLFFGWLFRISKKCMVPASLVGMAGYGVYMLALHLLGAPVGANFFAALTVAALSEILAHVQKAPASIYAIIGLMPLVPGAGLYRTMLALVQGDYQRGVAIGIETLLVAGVIALSIAVVAVFAATGRSRRG